MPHSSVVGVKPPQPYPSPAVLATSDFNPRRLARAGSHRPPTAEAEDGTTEIGSAVARCVQQSGEGRAMS